MKQNWGIKVEKIIGTKQQYKDMFITDKTFVYDGEDGPVDVRDIVAYLGLNNSPIEETICITEWNSETKKVDSFWFNTIDVIEAIEEKVNECGRCDISFNCSGRTRHIIQAKEWATAMPEFDWDFSVESYGARATKRK